MGSNNSTTMPNGPIRRRLTTVVATDICGYSSLSELSDQRAIQAVDTVYALFEKSVDKHQGRVFKRIADGFLAEFPSTESAVRAAVEFTKTVKTANATAPQSVEKSDIRTGIHVGDVTERENGDLLGHGVNVAVRLQENARINGILASQNVIDLLGQSFPYSATRRGMVTLKNISKPIAAFDIMGFPQSPLQVFLYKFKTLAAKPIRVGIVSILALGLLWGGNSAIQSKALDSRLAKIQTAYFSNPSVSAYDNELNASYLYRVLQDLAESNQPSDQAVFALTETGDVEGATAAIETAIETMDENNSKYLPSLHQIGALTYQRHPKKATEVYEKIVSLTPSDVGAISRLGPIL